MKKQTIKKEVSISGIGLHTGKPATLTLHPAESNHGIKFRRVDLEKKPIVLADVNYVVNTNRGTKLKSGDVEVGTVEHLMAALYGLGIDNVLIDLDGPEVPILDGSSKPFVDMIRSAGISPQDKEKEFFEVKTPLVYQDAESGAELILLPSEKFEITTMIDFNSPILGYQYAELKDMGEFEEKIAGAKTFVFVHELVSLVEQNLINGGGLDNAIVIADQKINNEDLAKLSKKVEIPEIAFDLEGIVNKSDLKYKNEPARHKLLDVIGDIALVGKPIKGKIVATKPGHRVNVEFAKILKKEILKTRKLKGKPEYDPNKPPVFDITAVKDLLPHRYPFLLVDKIIKLEKNLVVGIKNVTGNESFFQGHFPGNPVFPGVLQMESLAQTGGILALTNVDSPSEWDTYFLKMDNVKFKNVVLPGDTLILKMELLSPIRRGIVHMQGTVYVGDKITSEGELTAQIIKRTK